MCIDKAKHTSSGPTTYPFSPQDLSSNRKPTWLKTRILDPKSRIAMKKLLAAQGLHTVCQEANCPNIYDCWQQKTATIMILGNACTRNCGFCSVQKSSAPLGGVDGDEPKKVAHMVGALELGYVVITMVTRDDLADGGACQGRKVIEEVQRTSPGVKIEFLSSDLGAREESLKELLRAKPTVFSHNIETIRGLTPSVRDERSSYEASLFVLKKAKEITEYRLYTKSSILVGLGETPSQLTLALQELRSCDVDFVTIGQYLRPNLANIPVKKYYPPEFFKEMEVVARGFGFLGVASGPLVRSSYRASEFIQKID